MTQDTETSRYDRQNRIPGWSQEKLTNAYVAIVGSSVLANYTAAALAGLGIGNIKIYDNRRCKILDANSRYTPKDLRNLERMQFLLFDAKKGQSRVELLADKLMKINPEIRAEGIHWSFEYENLATLLGKPSVIVDATNRPTTEYNLFKYGKRNNIPVINGGSTQFKGEVSVLQPNQEIPETYMESSYTGVMEDASTSSVIAGVMSDLVRKIVMPLEGDADISDKVIVYNKLSNKRFSLVGDKKNGKQNDLQPYEVDIDKKVVIVGAGSTGNFTGLLLAIKGVKNITIIDDDIVKKVNLNRQIMFPLYEMVTGDKVIGVKKAKRLQQFFNT